ncbi:hypothetical protein N3553_12285 [Pantoea dispersa]|uniref:hypothetical protein n=1 Tax=Pantoea dispersa TaxID=59814 RepID=UPI0021AF3FC3|nr:hypothetical protein [Pantoea dispersa]MCT6590661.1 hypothetical protein [Pantoea dispersa]
MSLLSVMVAITVFALIALLARTGMLQLLIWIKPNDYIRLNYKDADGNSHVKDIKVGKDIDSLELIKTLNDISSGNKNTSSRGKK